MPTDDRNSRDLLKGIRPGQVITARWLSAITEAVNANTRAIRSPRQLGRKRTGDGAGNYGLPPTGEGGGGNEVFEATATDITSETVTITDDGGNDHDSDRITQIVLTETTTGRTMTFNITYT